MGFSPPPWRSMMVVRSMPSLRFTIPFVFLGSVPLGFAFGGPWSFLALAIVPASLCGFDWMLGSERDALPAGPDSSARWLPRLYVCLQLAVTAWAVWAVAQPGTSLFDGVGLTLSAGMAAGVFGMV